MYTLRSGYACARPWACRRVSSSAFAVVNEADPTWLSRSADVTRSIPAKPATNHIAVPFDSLWEPMPADMVCERASTQLLPHSWVLGIKLFAEALEVTRSDGLLLIVLGMAGLRIQRSSTLSSVHSASSGLPGRIPTSPPDTYTPLLTTSLVSPFVVNGSHCWRGPRELFSGEVVIRCEGRDQMGHYAM